MPSEPPAFRMIRPEPPPKRSKAHARKGGFVTWKKSCFASMAA
jgi:hypothetical protein